MKKQIVPVRGGRETSCYILYKYGAEVYGFGFRYDVDVSYPPWHVKCATVEYDCADTWKKMQQDGQRDIEERPLLMAWPLAVRDVV